MSRNFKYRRQCSDAVSWRQDQALNATMYILKMYGPTGFLLKEDGEPKDVKVYIGDPHTCTCSVFQKERDICKHVSWLLLKKYKIPRENPETWQLGLVERDIQRILHQAATPASRPARAAAGPVTASGAASNTALSLSQDSRPALQQRDIGADDVCPICQDGLLAKHEPVTFCKYGCANSIHIKCMKVWADHQTSQGETAISCPFCREDFGPFAYLKEQYRNTEKGSKPSTRPAEHPETICRGCRVSPITGKCYRCVTCSAYYLCQACLNTPIHQEHISFEYRQTPVQRWRPVERNILGGSALPAAVASSLMNRAITDRDYDLLLQLDAPNAAPSAGSCVPEHVVNGLPQEKVRAGGSLLAAGEQCRVCLRAYQIDQLVRRLPCRHKFHQTCIDNWLLHQRGTCPVDGLSVWNAIVAQQQSSDASHPQTKTKPGLQGAANGSSNVESNVQISQPMNLIGILTVNGNTTNASTVEPMGLPLVATKQWLPTRVANRMSVLPPSSRQASLADRRPSRLAHPQRTPVSHSAPPSVLAQTDSAADSGVVLGSLLTTAVLSGRQHPQDILSPTLSIGGANSEPDMVAAVQRDHSMQSSLRDRSHSAERLQISRGRAVPMEGGAHTQHHGRLLQKPKVVHPSASLLGAGLSPGASAGLAIENASRNWTGDVSLAPSAVGSVSSNVQSGKGHLRKPPPHRPTLLIASAEQQTLGGIVRDPLQLAGYAVAVLAASTTNGNAPLSH